MLNKIIPIFLLHFLLLMDISCRKNNPTQMDLDLFEAIRAEDTAEVKLLIEKGANVNAKNNQDRTPLFIAAMAGNIAAAEALLNNGANINARDDFNNTPLHMAVKSNNMVSLTAKTESRIEFAKLLLTRGAHVNAQNDRQNTPLHNAIASGWFKNPLLNSSESEYKAAYKEIIQALLEKGADPNIEDRYGRTPLKLAKGKPEIIELLIKYGAKNEK